MPITVSNMAAIQAMLNSQKAAIDVTVNAARDNVNANVDADAVTLAGVVNAARDNVKADNVAQMATQTAAINTNTNAKGVVKSIQRGVTSTTTTVTIAAVDPAKSFVSVSTAWQNAFGGGGVNAQQLAGRARLTSATALQVDTASANSFVNWEVVEYF